MLETPLEKTRRAFERHSFWEKRTLRGVGRTCLLACVAVAPFLHVDSDSPAQVSFQRQSPSARSFSELQAIIINDPYKRLNEDTGPEEVKRTFRIAGRLMNEATDGAIQVPVDVPVHEIDFQPTGTSVRESDGFTTECLTGEDIKNARERVLAQKGIPLITRTAVIVNTNETCYKKGGWTDKTREGVALTVYNSDISPHIVVHEETHVEGVGHASTLECKRSEGDESPESTGESWGERDIAALLARKDCTVPLNHEGNKNAYSNTETVMGSKIIDASSKHIYTFAEVNKLAPDAAPILDIVPEKQQHILGTKKHDLRGIRLTLPKNHPLHTIHRSIKFINIGFEHHLDGSIRSEIIATGAPVAYAIEYPIPYVPARESENFGQTKRTIYTDAALGVTITADNVVAAGKYLPDKALISVDTIPR